LSRRGTAEQWSARIKDYRASGERIAVWCERNQVSAKQFYYWMRKLKTADQQTPATGGQRWVALAVAESAATEAAPILVKIGTATIEVRAGFEPSVFAAVVRTLKTLC